MLRLATPLAATVLAGCITTGAAPVAPTELSRAERISILQGCQPRLSDAVLNDDRSWTLGADQGENHDALWAAFDERPPEAPARIRIYMSAVHHTRTEWSTVATRGDDGVWHVAVRGRTSSGLLSIDPRLEPPQSWALSAIRSAALTSLVDDPCVAAEPSYVADLRLPPNPGSGGWTLEIQTPRLTRQASGYNGWHGQSTLVADLLYADQP